MPTASGIPYQTVEIGRVMDAAPRTTRPPARLNLRRTWTITAITAALTTVAICVIEIGRLDGGWHAYPPELRALSLTLLGILWMAALIVWATDRICAHIDRAEYRQTATTTAQVASLERDEQQISDQVQQLTTLVTAIPEQRKPEVEEGDRYMEGYADGLALRQVSENVVPIDGSGRRGRPGEQPA